jgi:hypothetical protein
MISFFPSTNNVLNSIVKNSLSNSFLNMVSIRNSDFSNQVLILVNPSEIIATKALKEKNKKIIIFGRLPKVLEEFFSLNQCTHEFPKYYAKAEKSTIGVTSSSKLFVKYENNNILDLSDNIRFFERFDFEDEWNNLNFGSINIDESIYSLANYYNSDKTELASVYYENSFVSVYSLIRDTENSSIFWFNRAVGPFDSYEWRFIEDFISSYRYKELPCIPLVEEIPDGYSSASTMRLDCDEGIKSSLNLYEAYKKLKIPFSLAIPTSDFSTNDIDFLKDVISNSGTIMSHSHNHKHFWGSDQDDIFEEAFISKKTLEESLGIEINYAVSPFHETNKDVINALDKAGYHACFGGIINKTNDLLSYRVGYTQYNDKVIFASQQVMMHGDCLHNHDELSIYKKSFENSKNTKTIFAYLDHPFSPRYKYGWDSEDQRIEMHMKLIDFILINSPNHLFLSYGDLFNIIKFRLNLKIIEDSDKFYFKSSSNDKKINLQVKYKNDLFNLNNTLFK